MDKYYLIILLILIIIFYFIFFLIDINLNNKNIKYENFNNNEIPKIIIQTWKNSSIPIKYKKDVSSIKRYNKDYQYLFFSDADIESFLKNNYPDYYNTYLKLPIFIQKIDFFRYVAIYHYGGFYFDLDIRAFYPLDELLIYDCVFPVDHNITPNLCNKSRYNNYCDKNMNIILGQYGFGAKQNNPFIKELIDTIHNNIEDYIKKYKKLKSKKNKKSIEYQYVYSTTGPDFVTDVYLKYNNKKNIYILYTPDDQHFGRYAKHNFYGTWK
jgi:mannosyltransferase OCH1-like enzyme